MKIQCFPFRPVRGLVLTIAVVYQTHAPWLGAAEPGTPAMIYGGVVPGSAPRHWLENITHPDQSGSRLLVFQTVPGVHYVVEESKDLSSWVEVERFDGGGQQVLVPMVQTAPPPVPETPPATPPVPVTHTWLMMQKASAGGIVIYWHSSTPLENGRSRQLFQSHHFPELTLDPLWEEHFVYVRKFDNFGFSITHPRSVSVAPPDTVHSEKDQAMLDAFVENFATMNQEVHDRISAVRYIPPAAPPPDPNGRGFFRVRADWSVDTDEDSVPDWEELAMMAGVGGVGADGSLVVGNAQQGGTSALADPANADSNGNGIPDAEEQDFDGDGLSRAEDAGPLDQAIAWRKTRPTRYALFDLPVRTMPGGNITPPIDVNSDGLVLYEDGVRMGNAFHSLPCPAGGGYPRAFAINDSGAILGAAVFPSAESTTGNVSGAAVWPSVLDQPSLVASGGMRSSPPYDLSYGLMSFSSCFGNDGAFVSHGVVNGQPAGEMYNHKYLWAPDSNGIYQAAEIAVTSDYCAERSVHWGNTAMGNMVFSGPGGLLDFGIVNLTNYNVVGGGQPVLSGGTSEAMFFVNNDWMKSPTLGTVNAISDTGIANVWNAPAAEKIPQGLGFWMNDRFLNLETLVPGFPDSYKNWPHDTIKGMTEKGHFIITRSAADGYTLEASAIGYPCAVEDHISEAARLAFQDNEDDSVIFTGVDDVSITASQPDPSAQNKIWIMAPIGAPGGNDVKFHIPVSGQNPATLESPVVDGQITLSAGGQAAVVTGSGAASADADLAVKLGAAAALNAPIGIKAMKRRNVRVTITPVAVATPHNHPVPYDPSTALPAPRHMPATERLTKYLNKVYDLQINAHMEVTVRPQVTLNYSLMTRENYLPCGNNPDTLPFLGNSVLDCSVEDAEKDFSLEELAFAPLRDPGADINVYVLAGSSIVGWSRLPAKTLAESKWYGVAAWGIAKKSTREAWVDGDWLVSDWYGYGTGDIITRQVMHTIAHEMGHIIIGDGHPDDGEKGYNGGPAPLPGTYYHDRLMVAGGGPLRAILPGGRIVKGEWDAAEQWFKNRPNGDQ